MKYLFLIFYNFFDNFFHLLRIKKFLKKKIFFKKPIIFDVGCHKGKIAKLFFEIYKDAKIYCFEPNKLLIKKIRENNFKKNLVICNYALGDKNQKKNIKINNLDLTSSLSEINTNSVYLKIKEIIIGSNINSSAKRVNIIKLDRFCELRKIKKIDLIKIDVEGYEYRVLQGAKKILQNTHYIIIEIQNNNLYKNYSSSNIEKFLKNNNFILLKKFNFPFMFFQDRLYKNKKINL
jgi:FkbM family methyltransferase